VTPRPLFGGLTRRRRGATNSTRPGVPVGDLLVQSPIAAPGSIIRSSCRRSGFLTASIPWRCRGFQRPSLAPGRFRGQPATTGRAPVLRRPTRPAGVPSRPDRTGGSLPEACAAMAPWGARRRPRGARRSPQRSRLFGPRTIRRGTTPGPLTSARRATTLAASGSRPAEGQAPSAGIRPAQTELGTLRWAPLVAGAGSPDRAETSAGAIRRC
jgi:hypothetical protein